MLLQTVKNLLESGERFIFHSSLYENINEGIEHNLYLFKVPKNTYKYIKPDYMLIEIQDENFKRKVVILKENKIELEEECFYIGRFISYWDKIRLLSLIELNESCFDLLQRIQETKEKLESIKNSLENEVSELFSKIENDIFLSNKERLLNSKDTLTAEQENEKNEFLKKYGYKIVPFPMDEKRFAISDIDNNIINDAQGYGYHTKESAEKARWYWYLGGKEEIEYTEEKKATKVRCSYMKKNGEQCQKFAYFGKKNCSTHEHLE